MFPLTAKTGKGYVIASTMISATAILIIIITLAYNSVEAISQIGWQLFSLEWNPPKARFGMLSMLYGSAMVTLVALVIAVPLGVLTALFTAEILPVRYRVYVKSLLELLAGIPSIIYGLLGIAFIGIWISDLFNLQSGRTLLTAGVVLSFMILPLIITLTDDALYNVPRKYRETASGLGLYRVEIITSVVLPIAKANIAGAVLLALGRAIGETMAVMLLIGGIDTIPQPFFNVLSAGQTITSKIGREIPESAFGSLHFSALIFMGLTLLLIVLAVTIIAQHYFNREQQLYE
ncbi:MAG: phosphate ABC transporter permease subunit PstC [Gammaproteobacteria bacterium]